MSKDAVTTQYRCYAPAALTTAQTCHGIDRAVIVTIAGPPLRGLTVSAVRTSAGAGLLLMLASGQIRISNRQRS